MDMLSAVLSGMEHMMLQMTIEMLLETPASVVQDVCDDIRNMRDADEAARLAKFADYPCDCECCMGFCPECSGA